MSGSGRRPARPGMGQGWVPGVTMPPLGYGLVAQQPLMPPPQHPMAPPQHPMAPHPHPMGPQQQWQQQQQQHFMMQQAGLTSGPLGVATLTQQQQQQQQQQWLEAQRRAAEEQRKLYGQMMKQRQFDEQKMRLKAYSSSRKAGVSADTMIESILGGREQQKLRSPLPLQKAAGTEAQGGQAALPLPTHSQQHRQGSAVDWTKMDSVNSLFVSPKKTNTTTTTTTTEHSNPPPQDTTPTTAPNQTPQPGANATQGKRRKEGKKPVALPQWLQQNTETDALPEVYQRAVGLVAMTEGWVDTSRAYMLLMKTGLPPPLLGVLWEMVNCTAPGQLTQGEFMALLALVAFVQAGQPIPGPDILSTTTEPLLPLIDHPALSPLVQDYIQARQQQAESGDGTTQHNSVDDSDEFDDFVSVTVASDGAVPFQQANGTAPQPLGPNVWPQVAAPKPLTLQAIDKSKAMNLPKLGFSPERSPTASFDDDFDDFQSASLPSIPQGKVLSGGEGGVGVPTPPTGPPEHPFPTPVLLPERQIGDRYAVFRDITSLEPTDRGDAEITDESFGEFCSSGSEVANINLSHGTSATSSNLLQSHSASGTSNTSPISFEVYSTPPETLPETQTFEADFSSAFAARPADNYADIHEAMKRAEVEQRWKEESGWSDPFGEFEEAPSGGGGGVPWLSVGEEEEEEDENFGAFMGAGDGGGGGGHALPHPLECGGETQSVASLELPGLEMTVGMEGSDGLGIGSTPSPDPFLQPRGDALEEQLSGLTLESSTAGGGGGGGVNNSSSLSGVQQQQQSVMEAYCSSGLVDKYSIIREEADRDAQPPGEAHTGSWERCLQGCVKVLQEAQGILTSLALPPALKTQVLNTSQMQDYLANVQEVWLVCGRIGVSSGRVTTSGRVDELLCQAKALWQDILAGADQAIGKPQITPREEGDNQMGQGEVCGVCLAGGGSRLTYGGHSYHPPCANLWLNCVDLLLPSLTPVTLL